MKRLVQFSLCSLLIILFFTKESHGQTLTEELLKEPAAKLLLEARERGDVVRGAILFHQGNIACAKCHRPTAEKDRIGPDLSRVAATVSNESFVESILQPSKLVAKEYQTTVVIRMDGLTSTGVVLKEDENSVVLRDASDVDKLITIPRSNIDAMVAGTKSIMPEGLADELKDKQQFLDLLRYVLDTKERGPVSQLASTGMAQRQLSDELQGLALIRKLNCAACHEADPSMANWVKPSAPDLKWSAKEVRSSYIGRFISDPQAAKPGATMPQMPVPEDAFESTHPLSSPESESARLITDYLVSLDDQNGTNPFLRSLKSGSRRGNIQRGRDLFHSVGCAACHSPRDEMGNEIASDGSIPMGDLLLKFPTSALIDFLKNPHAARPSGRMPDMQLTHGEAVDISEYLQQRGLNSSGPPPSESKQRIAKGKALFRSMNCAKCHSGIIADDGSKTSFTPLANLNPKRGCLAEKPTGQSPVYTLTRLERSQISAALDRSSTELSNDQQIDLTLTHFNCTACHSRDDLGGISTDRNPHFQTTNLNLGEQGRIPPTLTGVGAKLKRKWLRDVLVNGKSIRPYMKTRMPQFGEDNIGHLIDLFQDSDKLEDTTFAEVKDQKKARDFGLKLVGNQGLNCVACHTYQYKISDTMPAVDLTEMADRLHKDWFYQYMLAPQKFSPNTVMPSFWPNGNAIRSDLEGSAEDQVEAIWTYLLDGRQARAPRGVIREPLEIVVTNEARILRRAYPGMGKRGIGVGYPGGVNLAFDAEQMRLAMIWKGRFVDPSGVWYGQGHGRVRPMGQIISFPKGPDLDSASTPWVADDGRPPTHQFKGYRLDSKRRPTFRYEFNDVQVEDFFTENSDSTASGIQLKRIVNFRADRARTSLQFRLAVSSSVDQLSDREFAVGDRLKLRIVSNHAGNVLQEEAGSQIVIPLTLADAETQELVVEYIWD